MTREYSVRYTNRKLSKYRFVGDAMTEIGAISAAKVVNDWPDWSAEVVSREVGDWVPVGDEKGEA